jgi:TP901-1 family phage major tail protein
MAAAAGIALVVKKAGTAIAGIRSNSIKFSVTPIDISSADDAGVRKLFTAHTGQQFTISGSGVEKGGVLATLWAAPATSKYLTDVTFTIPTEATSTDVFTGDVIMTAFEVTAAYDGTVEFNYTFESAGTWSAA